jgi:hypothetical protein
LQYECILRLYYSSCFSFEYSFDIFWLNSDEVEVDIFDEVSDEDEVDFRDEDEVPDEDEHEIK